MSAAETHIVVSESRVVQAMAYWEREHIARNGPLDRISLPKAVSGLADLLGAMWFEHEVSARLPLDSGVANLILEAEKHAG